MTLPPPCLSPHHSLTPSLSHSPATQVSSVPVELNRDHNKMLEFAQVTDPACKLSVVGRTRGHLRWVVLHMFKPGYIHHTSLFRRAPTEYHRPTGGLSPWPHPVAPSALRGVALQGVWRGPPRRLCSVHAWNETIAQLSWSAHSHGGASNPRPLFSGGPGKPSLAVVLSARQIVSLLSFRGHPHVWVEWHWSGHTQRSDAVGTP